MKGKSKRRKVYQARLQNQTVFVAEIFPLTISDFINRKKLVDFEIEIGRIYILEDEPCVDISVCWWVDV
jgi:hypothetical protein